MDGCVHTCSFKRSDLSQQDVGTSVTSAELYTQADGEILHKEGDMRGNGVSFFTPRLGLVISFRDERPLTCTCSKEWMSNRRLDRNQPQTPMNMPCRSAASRH